MGFFQGVAKAVGEISEENFTRRERQKDRDLQVQRDSDAFEREKQLAKYRSDLETRQALMLNNVKSSRSGSSGKSDQMAGDLAKLKAMGVSDENIQRIASTESPEAIGNITSMISDRYEQAAEISPSMAQEFRTNLNPLLAENLIINPSKEESFRIDGWDEVLTTTTPGGGAVWLDPEVAPADASEVGRIEERIIARTQRLANSEAKKLNTALTEITGRMEGATGSQLALLESAADVLGKRLESVSAALESEQFEPLLQLYGTSPVDSTLEAFGGTVRKEQLDPAFNEEYEPMQPFDFEGRSEAETEALQLLFRRLNLG